MKEKKKSAISWILTWAGQKRIAYVWSVLLAIGNVIFKILPYFIIADIVKLFLNGEKEFEIYLAKAVLIALSFIIAELLHSLSTAFPCLLSCRNCLYQKLCRICARRSPQSRWMLRNSSWTCQFCTPSGHTRSVWNCRTQKASQTCASYRHL